MGGELWVCGSCGAPNAAYRRRCLTCSARRAGDVLDAGDVPLPLAARRRERRLGRWPTILLVVAVLALAVYGAVTYFAVDPVPP